MSDPTPMMGEKERDFARHLSAAPAQPPLQVPGYRQEQFLGRGAYGEVWMAVNSNIGKRVAIKFYTQRGGLDWTLLSQEVEKLSYLFHDRYVVQLLEVGWKAEPPYYVMEYMEKGSLEDYLKDGPLPVAEALEMFQEIAVGLVHAHGKGILHCDLKPANILLDQDFKPRLCDFGQSRLTHEQAPALGTLFYMAPEQADLSASPDVRWDVYALGAVLYRMLTGAPPHRSPEALATFQEKGSLEARLQRYREFIEQAPPADEHRRVPYIDAALVQIIDRCLAFKPHDRFPNVQAVLDALQARRRRLARRPLLLMGMLGSTMVLGIMAVFASVMLNSLIHQSLGQLTAAAQENNLFAAEYVAKQIAADVDKRWRVLEEYAGQKEFRHQLAEFLDAEPDSPERQEAKQWIQNWVDEAFARSNGVFPEGARAYSWFVNERTEGIQIARHPHNEKTIGHAWWHRDYFHGLEKNIDDQEEYLKTHKEIPEPIRKPHRSMVYKSGATGAYGVAFSVPVWADPPGKKPLGVLGMALEIGKVPLNRKSTQIGVLIDTRRMEKGERGVIIAHPEMARNQNSPLAVDAEVVERAVKLQRMYLPDTGEQSSKKTDGEPANLMEEMQGLALLPKYRDPVPAGRETDWLAALSPVVVYRGPGQTVGTDWVVIVQLPRNTLEGPMSGLRLQLLIGLALAVLAVLVVVMGLWWLVNLLLSDRHHSRVVTYLRRRLGLESTTISQRTPSEPRQTPGDLAKTVTFTSGKSS